MEGRGIESSYALGEGDEEDIEDEKERWIDIFPQDFPAIVFRADFIAPFSPVVVGQTGLKESVTELLRGSWIVFLTLQTLLMMAKESNR